MGDKEIRTALKCLVEKQCANISDTLIIDELAVGHGHARIDVAVVNGNLHGYELKSDKDSLYRLEEQALAYNKVFDKITLVSGKKHVFKALKKIPEWWGIKIAECGSKGTVKFHAIRKAKNNPDADPISILELLWKKEALAFLDEIDELSDFRSKNKKVIYQRIAEKSSINVIRKKVRNVLRSRLYWRSDESRPSGDD
ncbi:sce7726 family protein [bacterium]|nr:sce7726 family protein [bacterium]